MNVLRSAAVGLTALACSCAALGAVLNISLGADGAAQRDGFKQLVADFRAANPDVEVHLTLTDVAGYRKDLPASLATDAAPDVFNGFAGEQLFDMAQRGDLDDLGDVWKANAWANTFPGAAVTLGGKPYALPYQSYTWGLFTRRDVLERAGLRDAPRDLAGVLSACSKLRKAGFTPIALGARNGEALSAWFDHIDLRVNGHDFHDQLLDGKIAWTDSSVRRSFAMWRQLVDAQCFDANAATIDERNAEALLYAGRAGMLLMGTVVSAGFPEIVRPVIDYQRFPTIDAGQAPAEVAPTDTFQVAARARNKADARRFLKFAGGNAADAKLAQALGSFPTNKFSPVAGTVLDLASYKVLAEAKTNLVQGLVRDVPAEMARAAIAGFQQFLAKPDDTPAILARLEVVRATAYASRSR